MSGRHVKARSVRKPKRGFRGNQHTKQIERESESNDGLLRPGSSVAPSASSESSSSEYDNSVSSEEEILDATSKKLPVSSDSDSDILYENSLKDNQEGYRLIDLKVLSHELENFSCICSVCLKGTVLLTDTGPTEKKGFASYLSLKCSNVRCGHKKNFFPSDRPTSKHRFDVNSRMTMAFRRFGKGHAAMSKFCGIMNMTRPMAQTSFDACTRDLNEAAQIRCRESLDKAAVELKQLYEPNSETDTLEVAVSGDGSWPTRGFSSNYGAYFVMSIVTGKVLDVHIMSKYCRRCSLTGDKMDKDSEEYKQWKESHVCEKNYEGSSPGMEVEGVKVVFAHSEQKHSLQYTSLLCDGDSKGFEEAKKVVTYDIEKLDCINHVAKHMGTALRNLKKKGEILSDGKGWGGRNRLTDPMIVNMQNYYHGAIINNLGDVETTQRAIWVTLYHHASTDENPQHDYCPDAPDTWCKWKKKEAGDEEFKDFSHMKNKTVPSAIVEKLVPTFEQLSNEDLIGWCKEGGTQNQNEALHGVIWGLCQKEEFVGFDTLTLSVNLGVCLWNDGEGAVSDILQKIGCVEGSFQHLAVESTNNLRCFHSKIKSSKGYKIARKRRKAAKKNKEDRKKKKEGTTYAAGGY